MELRGGTLNCTFDGIDAPLNIESSTALSASTSRQMLPPINPPPHRLARSASVFMTATAAPERRDIIWFNAAVPLRRITSRIVFSKFLLSLAMSCWAAVSVLCSTLPVILRIEPKIVAEAHLEETEERDATVFELIVQQLPVLALVGLLNLLPVLFKLYGTFYEQRKSQSDVDVSREVACRDGTSLNQRHSHSVFSDSAIF